MSDRVYVMRGHEAVESEPPLERAHQVARIYEAQERIVTKLQEERKILFSMYVQSLDEQIDAAKGTLEGAKAWLIKTIEEIPDRKNIKHGRTTYGVKEGSGSVIIDDTEKAANELLALGPKGKTYVSIQEVMKVDKKSLKMELQSNQCELPVLESIRLETGEVTLTARRRQS